MTGARDFALLQLDAIRLPDWPARAARHHLPPPTDMRDLALAEQIRVGLIKNLLWLQTLVEHHSGRGRDKIDPLVQKILAIGMYQLRFLSRIPPRAAVDEAVEQCRRFGRSKASGFVNAVLRNALRNADPDDLPEALRLSHPTILFQRLLKVYDGDEEAALALCRRHNQEPPTIVRLSPGRTIGDLAGESAAKVELRPHEAPGMVVAEHASRAVLADWARRGVAQVQDPTAAAVAVECDVQPGQAVLDRCSGVGTKTLQLAELAGATGKVFAIDPNAHRCEMLRRMLAERRIASVGVIEASWVKDAAGALPKQFDRVLVDAPCSNSGVLIRRPEARYAQSAGALRSLGTLQKAILADTVGLLRPGGIMVYSTCSIWPEENQRIVDWLLANHGDLELVRQTVTLPSVTDDPTEHHDGGFAAVVQRR